MGRQLRKWHARRLRRKQIILCTGGGSGLYYVNDNPPQVTGDGYVLGFRAGVPLLGIEMIDFQAMCCSPQELFGFAPHPTGFINAGAVFSNQNGEEFLKHYFPDTAEESTRSEVILAMAKEIHAGRATPTGGIFMDATKVAMELIQKQIPHVYKTCLHRGIDITRRRSKWRPEATLGSAVLRSTSMVKRRSTGFSLPARRREAFMAATGSAARRCRVPGLRPAGRPKAAALAKSSGRFRGRERSQSPKPNASGWRACCAATRASAIRCAHGLPHVGPQQARPDPRRKDAQGGAGGVRTYGARRCDGNASQR